MSRTLHPDLTPEARRRLFREGVKLFNAGRYYDCHEAFEEIWRSTTPQPRDLHQGLIQVAVGLHHALRNGRPGAGGRVLARGRRRLSGLAADQHGLPGEGDAVVDVAALLAEVDRWLEWLGGAAEDGGAEAGDRPPRPRIRWRREEGAEGGAGTGGGEPDR